MRIRLLLLLAAALLLPVAGLAEDDDYSITEVVEYILITDEGEMVPDSVIEALENPAPTPVPTAGPAYDPAPRNELIDGIIALGQELYEKANGRPQKAADSGDIYVCKNFTTYLFRKNRDSFRMAEYPDVQLKIPNNMPSAGCKPYYYGLMWEDVSAAEGNPFYEAASFRYNTELSKEENMALACDFMRQAQRGDFFQMSAEYYYGTGAHSAIMLGYDAETDEIHWMDSNMRGTKKNGVRYGYVQYDEVKSVTWWAEAFCLKKRGATLYRLREDIIYAP